MRHKDDRFTSVGSVSRSKSSFRHLSYLAFSLIGVLLTSCTHEAPEPLENHRQQLIHELQTTLAALQGAWTFEDGTTPWSGEVARRYPTTPCNDVTTLNSGGRQRVDISLFGPPVSHLHSAVKEVGDTWRARGFTVTIVVPIDSGHPEITTITPGGISLAFTANASGSSLSAKTGCSHS